MATTLTYGKATTCLLDSGEVIHLRAQQRQPLPHDEIVAAVRSQLAEPLNYPPLSQATIPGDRIVLAVEHGIPQQVSVIDGALAALRDAGADEAFITILLASPLADSKRLRTKLTALGYSRCPIKIHDPDNEKDGAVLGVTQGGRAMRLNRLLCDADFVLPLTVTTGELRGSSAIPRFSRPSFAGLFPGFSDREAIDRFSTLTAEHNNRAASPDNQAAEHDNQAASPDDQATFESRIEIEDCGRLLGVGMTVQVVPSPGGHVASIHAGEPTKVSRLAQEKYHQTWGCETPLRGDLVIATLTGDTDQQTWQNLGRALAAAEAVLESGGAITICSELAEPPGRALSQLMGNEDPLVVEREILRNPSADSGPAMQLCRALQRGAVFLRSRLRPSVVESLGMTPLESDTELERLVQSLRPCLVLEEAQRLLPTVITRPHRS